jgi:hypothetical protein
LFGWRFEESPHAPSAYFVIKNGDRDNGGLMQMDDNWDAKIPPHWSVYFTVENADAASARIERLGGKICAPPFAIPQGRIAVVSDPQGATFCLFEFGAGVAQP